MKVSPGQRIVYQTDDKGFYIGEAVADPDPLTPGRWLLPAGAVNDPPPMIVGMKQAKWVGYKWRMVEPE